MVYTLSKIKEQQEIILLFYLFLALYSLSNYLVFMIY